MPKMIHITIEGKTFEVEQGTSILQLIEQDMPERKKDALAVLAAGDKIKGLRWQPPADADVRLLTYDHEEARRMYERSARFLLLLAARDVLPGAELRYEYSAGFGVYATVARGAKLNAEKVARLQQRMHELVAKDLPFEHTRWPKEQALAYFREQGRADKLHLMEYSDEPLLEIYTCDGWSEAVYGEMLPSTGFVSSFSLTFYFPGVVLQLPAPGNRERPAPFQRRPKLLRAYQQSAKWGRILGMNNAADLNDAIRQGRLREIVRVSEALHEKSLAHIADDIAARGSRLVLIAGPSSSGKTTFANRLSIQLRVNALHPVSISLDNYYRNRDDVPLDEEGKPDLETVESIDLPLFNQHLVQLLAGEEVEIPAFSFRTGRRKEKGSRLRVSQDQPILIEGIHGLNPRLSESVPVEMTYRVYISALTTLSLDDHNRIRTTDVRLLRRMVRDHQFRHSPPERTFSMWPSVRAGEEKYIFPFQEQADVMFNSTLPYELCILKQYAQPLLEDITQDNPYYLQANRLHNLISYFLPGNVEDEVPPTSILREFIGGNSFYMHQEEHE